MPRQTCTWLISQPGTFPAEHCDALTTWKMEDDNGESGAPKVRKYNAFCDAHELIIKRDLERESWDD